MITSHRLANKQYELKNASGAVVGRAWRWPHRSKGWGMCLHGVYWRGEEFNQRGGNTTTGCNSLTQCREKAASVLSSLGLA